MPHAYAYQAIEKFYGSRKASRSQIPLINHIHEGVRILQLRGASMLTQDAFCFHPLFQNDVTFIETMDNSELDLPAFKTLIYVMEYRTIANAYLPKHYNSINDIPIPSILPEVNEMLIADKIQNRKDCELYYPENTGDCKDKQRLVNYFKVWLSSLGISEEYYQLMKAVLTEDE